MTNPQQLAAQGLNHAAAGRVKQAEEIFRTLAVTHPTPMCDIIIAGLLPVIYESQSDLLAWRTRLEQNLRRLAQNNVHMDITHNFAVPEFMAQYQGLNDRELQTLRANLYIAPQPQEALRRPTIISTPNSPRPKIRIALLSRHFKNHTIGRLMMGLVAQLPRDDFHLTVITFGPPPKNDDVADFFQKHADTFAALPMDLPQARAAIVSGKFDILYYADLGMEPVTYTLALSRLAPVQCVTWGHPVTSGMKTVDYFISAEGLEPENSPEAAHDQYTEKLIKLQDLAIYYYRPKLESPPVGPQHFNLPDDANLYGCPQSLYKFHPDFDPIIAGILRADPDGLLLLLAAHHKEWEEKLLARFNTTMPDVTSRIRFIPRQNREGFLQLNALCDVMLDPLHFGGGNTTYEALALGTPVVTLPSQLLRGRLAYKMYQTMNMLDCVATTPDHYIQLAVRLGLDAQFHKSIREKILTTCPILFENKNGIHQLANFFKSVVPSHPPKPV